jgi:hypothetical protein
VYPVSHTHQPRRVTRAHAEEDSPGAITTAECALARRADLIDQIDRRLQEWVRTVVDVAEVSLGPPGGPATERGVGLYLMELGHRPPSRGARRPPLQLTLHYLVTAWAERPDEEHRILGELALAALAHPEFEVQLDPVPVAAWTAFGVKPRPSFVVGVALRREHPEAVVPTVRTPPVVNTSPVGSLHGVVLGPEDLPVMGADVELPALQRSTRTDSRGRFRFAAIPTGPQVQRVRVRAKGQEVTVAAERAAGTGEPVVVRLPLGS